MAPRGDLSDSHFVTAAGVRVHYKEAGEGYPVICLHGAGPGANSESNFRRNIGALSEGFRAVLVDMPQFGRSEKVPITEGRLGFNARVLDAFMTETGIERAHYIGNSMGGQAALKLAIDNPERVDRLVVLGPGAINNPIFAPSPLEGVKLIADYYKGEGPTREKLRKLLETLVYDSSFLTDEIVEERFLTTIEPDNLDLFARRQGRYKKEDLYPDLGKIESPTLIVWGMDDRFGALDVGLQMTRLMKHAQMHIFARCGHWAQVEHADAFNRLVVGFMSD